MRIHRLAALTIAMGAPALATANLSELIGFTLTQEKTVVGYIEHGKVEQKYNGCKRGRILIFEDNDAVVCEEYNYQYANKPVGYIFQQGSRMKIVIDDAVMEVRPLRSSDL